jgi:predicted RNA-binding Zn-ribbon protein involved in translation (DUF1610 family)
MRKVNGLSLNFIDFYVPALISSLNSTENSLQLSENNLLCGQSHIYRCHQHRDLDVRQVFGRYQLCVCMYYMYIYILYSVEPCGISACISHGVVISPATETLNFL